MIAFSHSPGALAHTDLWLTLGAYATAFLALGGVVSWMRRELGRRVSEEVDRVSASQIDAKVTESVTRFAEALATALDPLRADVADLRAQARRHEDLLGGARETVAAIQATTTGNAAMIAGVSTRLNDLRGQFTEYLERQAEHRKPPPRWRRAGGNET